MSLNSFTTILSAKIKVAFALNLFNNPYVHYVLSVYRDLSLVNCISFLIHSIL
jgi:hypothetical protein